VSFLSTAVQDVLDRGQFCAVATMTPRGPHCTPLVYVGSGARVWLTTCTLDGPYALPNYRARGMVPFRTATVPAVGPVIAS